MEFRVSGSGHVSPQTLAVVVNVHNFAVSEYANFKFNSFTRFNGVYFGADESGLRMFHGDVDKEESTEAPVVAALETGSLKFDNSGSLRRFLDAYLNFRAYTGDLVIGLVNEENVENRYKYSHDSALGGAGAQRARFKLGRGIKYVETKLSINNGSGGRVDVMAVSVAYETLSRKSRNSW